MRTAAKLVLVAFLSAIAAPAFAADPPKTPEDCKKMYEGDEAKIEACIKDLKK